MAGRKSKSAAVGRSDFAALLADVKGRIQVAQTRAVLAVNAELVRLYWDIGRIIHDRQKRAGWGAAVIPRLARELHNELPDLKGFSERNIKLMVQLASEYPHAFPTPDSIGQLPVAQVPWAHNVLLMQKVKDVPTRRWYMGQTLANGWSRNVLALQIEAQAHARHSEARCRDRRQPEGAWVWLGMARKRRPGAESRLARGRARPEARFPVAPSRAAVPEDYAAALAGIKSCI